VVEVLSEQAWRALERAHADRVDAATSGHRARRVDGRAHPVEDFLFSYYGHTPAQLRRWHPGPGVRLEGAAGDARAGWRHHRVVDGGVELDTESFLVARGRTVDFVRTLLSATLSRPARLGCFGLHEWAMVHRLPEEEVRHRGWPLRLGAAGTDRVVEEHDIRCSHADAFRFFTASARPLNTLQPRREDQVALEQPGCLHAGMDVYKWSFKLAPLVPSQLTADAFDLAREIRVLDMQASPYDLGELGYAPVRIETPTGRAEYSRRQGEFAARSNELRRRLLRVLDSVAPATDESVTAAG
jgi:hypothetical protein